MAPSRWEAHKRFGRPGCSAALDRGVLGQGRCRWAIGEIRRINIGGAAVWKPGWQSSRGVQMEGWGTMQIRNTVAGPGWGHILSRSWAGVVNSRSWAEWQLLP